MNCNSTVQYSTALRTIIKFRDGIRPTNFFMFPVTFLVAGVVGVRARLRCTFVVEGKIRIVDSRDGRVEFDVDFPLLQPL